jgi:CRISPR-associated exonuclease Cas4
MQLTAYLLLVEENYDVPQYGLLMYGSNVYRIEYEEDLKKVLLQKVDEMRRALETGEVHRNHNRPGKCRHCSRRDICPERLA